MKNVISLFVLVLALAACGGGGGGGGSATVDVPITVVDGPIKNAKVCLDKNDNGICDSGEPVGMTDAVGRVTLKVDPTDVGKYVVLSIIEAGVAEDVDNGPVTTTFSLKAPADKTSMITPLTNLVVNEMQVNGQSSDAAALVVQAQTGISVSLFDDFSKGTTAAHKNAANIARMVVVSTQEQSNSLKDTVGTLDASNVTITKADLDKLILSKIVELLPKIVQLLNDPDVQTALINAQAKIDAAKTDAARAAAITEKDAAIKAQGKEMIASDGSTPAGVALAISVQKASSSTFATSGESSNTPIGYMNLRWLQYTDTNNYQFRVSTATASQNTLTDGYYRYLFRKYVVVKGTVAAWNVGDEPRRQADLHWNGSKWVACTLNYQNLQAAQDAKGRTDWNYCDQQANGISLGGVWTDIADKSMVETLDGFTKAGYTNLGAPSAALKVALGSSRFPAGSKAYMGNSSQTASAISYYPGSYNEVWPETSTPCTWVTGGKFTSAAAKTLEDLISKFSGKNPCVIAEGKATGKGGTALSSGLPNTNWNDTTMDMGTVGNAPTVAASSATSFFTSNTRLRVAFGEKSGTSGVATYYACKQTFDGYTRNCSEIGKGNYQIAVLGDGRGLTFTGLPGIASAIPWTRVFVERGGKVYWGYQDRTSVYKTNSLNTKATLALLAQLKVNEMLAKQTPAIVPLDPEVPLVLTESSYQGVYDVYAINDLLTPISTLTRSDANEISCSIPDSTILISCSSALNAMTGAFTNTIKLTGTNTVVATSEGTLDFISGIGKGTSTATGQAKKDVVVLRR